MKQKGKRQELLNVSAKCMYSASKYFFLMNFKNFMVHMGANLNRSILLIIISNIQGELTFIIIKLPQLNTFPLKLQP